MKPYKVLLLLLFLVSCEQSSEENHKYTNSLIYEKSPYLLQHAHNPVNWYAWNEETLQKAKEENKLLLISIGYSSCHWCQVMEEESFEDESVAKFMNTHFINVKIDREERPDIDKVYSNAVQLITGNSGWPLNCIALPDGSPVWGGTYFEKELWQNNISQVATLFVEDPDRLEAYAKNISSRIQPKTALVTTDKEADFSEKKLLEPIKKWSELFDKKSGGMQGGTKFPSPSMYNFLLRYSYQIEDSGLQDFVHLTLENMAKGGLYDHVDGGFFRYSTDAQWQIPHFEKMLYDNGQLLSLYSNAYRVTKNELYKQAVYSTVNFLENDLMRSEGGFYSSLNANSLNTENELLEGYYYTWNKDDLNEIIPKEDIELFKAYYSLNTQKANESHLFITETNTELVNKFNIDEKELTQKVAHWKTLLAKERLKKSKPAVDKKVLTSWNALTVSGLLEAYNTYADEQFLNTALQTASFLEAKLVQNNGAVYRSYYDDKATISGFLEDYALLTNAFINLYQATFDEKWLNLAKRITDYAFANFYSEKSKLFLYSSKSEIDITSEVIDIEDGDIPSSNSIMAKNLFLLGHFFGNKEFTEISKLMTLQIENNINNYPYNYSNWMNLHMDLSSFYEIAIVGKEAMTKRKEIAREYFPNKLISGTTFKSDLYLLEDRDVKGRTFIYVCQNNSCKLPTEQVSIALNLVNNN